MKTSTEWISISDMMTGLMMIFLFISVLYINESLKDVKNIKDVSKTYSKTKEEVYLNLYKEFHKDLKKWNAELIKEDLILRFLSPQIMFDAGKYNIKPTFQNILQDFCPRYFKALRKFDLISEIQIEGHTSKEWKGSLSREAYFKNMALSQNRTRSVLEYCINLNLLTQNLREWSMKKLTANGLSSSKPLCLDNSLRCRNLNRRVDFRVQINTLSLIKVMEKY